MPIQPSTHSSRLGGRWLPRTLTGRVYGLYTVTLLVFTLAGLLLFCRWEFDRQVERARDDARALLSVLAPPVIESAVIGDYDSINRVLTRAVGQSSVREISYTDTQGGIVRAADPPAGLAASPARFLALVRARLGDESTAIEVGGRRYGRLSVALSAQTIADDLWSLIRSACALGVGGLLAGLLLIRWPLRRWLGNLDRLRTFEAEIQAGGFDPARVLADDAPIEFRQAFAVLDRAVRQVQAQREQAAGTLDAIGDAVFTTDGQGQVVFVNAAAQALLGCPLERVAGQPLGAWLPGLDAVNILEPDWVHHRIEWPHPDGTARVFDAKRAVLRQGEEVTGQVISCRDVTEQHRLDLALKAEYRRRDAAVAALRVALESEGGTTEQQPGAVQATDGDIERVSRGVSRLVTRMQERSGQLDAIFTLSPDGFVSFDAERRVRYVSPGFCQLTGLVHERVMGLDESSLFEALQPLCSRSGGAALAGLRLAAFGSEHDGLLVDLDPADPLVALAPGLAPRAGQRMLVELMQPVRRTLEIALRRSEASAVAAVLHLRDVTREKEVEQMKSDFLTLAAHELRTPMSSIYGFTEILIARELPPARQKDVLQRVHRQSQVMIAILNELLDLARIEARRGKDFVPEEIDAAELALRAVAEFQPPADRAPPQLELPRGLARVRVDPGRMQQALRNLLSNAYKYSPNGGPVRVQLLTPHEVGVHGGPRRVGLMVQDEGLGLSPEQLEHVGERFYRADKSGNIPGTGLGVSIVREVVELHGGAMQVQSALGRGSRFTLWLPALLPEGPTALEDPHLSAAALSI